MNNKLPELIGIGVLIFSLLSSSIIFAYKADTKNQQDLEALFTQKQNGIVEEIEHTMANYRELFRGGKGLFAASDFVSRKKWKAYLDTLILEENFSAIRAFAFTRIIPFSQKQKYMEEIRKEGFPDFKIYPEGQREIYAPATYLEPFNETNKKVHGYDMWSEKNRQSAMRTAAQKNSAVISKKITLVEDQENNSTDAGFLMFLPVYKKQELQNRSMDGVYGFVYGLFRLRNLIEPIQRHYPSIKIEIFDGSTVEADNIMHTTILEDDTFSKSYKFNPMENTRTISLNHHQWTLRFTTLPDFGSELNRMLPIYILFIGILLSLLSFTVLWFFRRSKNYAEMVATERTHDLAKSEARMKLVLDNAGEGIFGLNTLGHTTFANRAAEKMLGYKIEEMLDQSQHELIHHSYADGKKYNRENCNIYAAFKDGQVRTVDSEVFWHKNGQPIEVEYTSTPIRNEENKITGAVVVFRDISERKKAEKEILFNNKIIQIQNEFKEKLIQELKESSDFQKVITDTIPDLMFVKDSEFRIVSANNAFLSAYPESMRNSIIGSTTVEQYDEDEANQFLENDKIAFKEGYHETEESILFPNGNRRTLFTKKVRFENTTGEKFILGISSDITILKETEEELMRSNTELERFAYIASHDLQEPMRMVYNFTSLLKEEYHEKFDDQARQYMKFITDGAERMRNLISDLLEYSRVGEEETGFSEFSAHDQISVVLDNLADPIAETNTKITISTLPKIHANPVRFSRLMQNLIGNGIKYRMEDRTPEIKVHVEDNNDHWLFSVEDNGIGIKEEYQDQIFVIFRRLHNKDEYSGTGIGLAVCKKIVESFNGTLWVQSKYGEGSAFYFTLPKKQQEREAA